MTRERIGGLRSLDCGLMLAVRVTFTVSTLLANWGVVHSGANGITASAVA